jgi:hypothetical protein
VNLGALEEELREVAVVGGPAGPEVAAPVQGEAAAAPMATERTKGAWYRSWRLVSLDGSTLDVADTKGNEQALGRPAAGRGASAYPQIRFVGLLEKGTHVLWGAHMSGCRTDEIALAQKVIPGLRPGMSGWRQRFSIIGRRRPKNWRLSIMSVGRLRPPWTN